MSMVLFVMLLVLLSIQLRQQPNLTIIQHNLKTDTPKEVEINKEFKSTSYTVIMSFYCSTFYYYFIKKLHNITYYIRFDF